MTKRFVAVGINAYPGAELAGCVNDALAWTARLKDAKYDGITLLDTAATGDAIIDALRAVVAVSRFGDRIVFTFSGHGTYYQDRDGDEPDRRDEAICPVDVFTQGAIVDDDLAQLFASRRVGVRVTMISDSCHSGTVARFIGESSPGTPKFITPDMIPYPPQPVKPMPTSRFSRAVPAQPLMLLAGCKDVEYSYDAHIDGRPCGAFTNACMKTLVQDGASTWTAMFTGARKILPSDDYPQTPQYEATAWQRRWKIA